MVGKGKVKKGSYDNHSRKELQDLCKRHGLPANKSHSEMKISLLSYFEKNSTSSASQQQRGTKMVDAKSDGNGLVFGDVQGNPQTAKSGELGDLLKAKTQDKEGTNGPYPAENAIPSLEFSVLSEDGINLCVDLNASPSDWAKTFKKEVQLPNSQCWSLHENLGCLREGQKDNEGSLSDITDSQVNDGHHTIPPPSSEMGKNDKMDVSENEDGSLIPSVLRPCSVALDASEQLKDDKAPKSSELNYNVEDLIISAAEFGDKDRRTVVFESDVTDAPCIKSFCDSAVNSVSDGPISSLTSEHLSSNPSLCQNTVLQNGTSLVNPTHPRFCGSGSVERQSSDVASCYKDASSSHCENPKLLGAAVPKINTETGKSGLVKSNELNHVPVPAEEGERINIISRRESSDCLQFTDSSKTCVSSDVLDTKEVVQKKRKQIEDKRQSNYGKTEVKILRSMTRRKGLPRRSSRLMLK
ncbi:hypothetical protein UlMin_010848 [Ulmus minor]